MKKGFILFLIVALLALAAGCSRYPDGSGISPSTAMPAPTQQEAVSLQTPPAAPQREWGSVLEGWWVYLGDQADPDQPVLYYLAQDGTVYLPSEKLENYDTALSQAGVSCGAWMVQEERLCLETDEFISGEIRVEEDGRRLFICREDGEEYCFAKNTTQQASRFLRKSRYANLAQAPRLGYAVMEETSESVFINEVFCVTREDEDLIAEFDLEGAALGNGYVLIDPVYAYEPYPIEQDQCAFFLLDEANNMLRPADWDEFAERVRQRGGQGMLVDYTMDAEKIVQITEWYLP